MSELSAMLKQMFWGRYTRWITLPVLVMVVGVMLLLALQSGTSWAPIVY
jgi:hypothetical protein